MIFSIFPSQLSRLLILFSAQIFKFLLHFLVVSKTLLIKSPIKQSLLHRTAGFFIMLTIAEATCKSKCIDISKVSWKPSLPSTTGFRIPGCLSANPSRQMINSRCVVVWRPRLSPSRTDWTAWISFWANWLVIVDFPTPEDPISATVCPIAQIRN